MYALQDVPGKGRGLIATEKISKGTRILSEEPIVTVPLDRDIGRLLKSISRQVDALSEQQRRAFLSMHNIYSYKDGNAAENYLGIIRTNALPVETDKSESAIFLNGCLINHACDNNSQKSWNANIKRHTVHALRDIPKGDEITIYYLGTLKNRKIRQAALQTKFAFACSCRLCSLPPKQSEESDRRLDEIFRLDGLIGENGMMGIISSPLRMLRYVDQQVSLYNEHGPDDNGLPRAFIDAAQIFIANGDLARGRVFAERAVAGWRTAQGGDSMNVIQYGIVARDPSKHELYRASMKWKTAADEAPLGLEPRDFEDWLWRREKSQPQLQLTGLRSRSNFPAFSGLPSEHDFKLDFYDSTIRPRRHWCFLGEIMELDGLVRLQLHIKDIDGTTIPVWFYTDDRGKELPLELVQKGNAVAILYAQSHAFKFDKPGIRLEDPATFKIFPLPLSDLLALNDTVQIFSMELEGFRKCHGCGKKAASKSLNRCAKCASFWYCSRACQQTGWKEKGHKSVCKLLKDPDLRGFVLFKWEEFSDPVRFPIHVA